MGGGWGGVVVGGGLFRLIFSSRWSSSGFMQTEQGTSKNGQPQFHSALVLRRHPPPPLAGSTHLAHFVGAAAGQRGAGPEGVEELVGAAAGLNGEGRGAGDLRQQPAGPCWNHMETCCFIMHSRCTQDALPAAATHVGVQYKGGML